MQRGAGILARLRSISPWPPVAPDTQKPAIGYSASFEVSTP